MTDTLYAKPIWSTTGGVTAVQIYDETRKIALLFNTERCSLIKGVDGYLSSFVFNQWRTFSPVRVTLRTKTVIVSLPFEGISFEAARVPLDDNDFLRFLCDNPNFIIYDEALAIE